MKKNAFRLMLASAIACQLISCTKDEVIEEPAKVVAANAEGGDLMSFTKADANGSKVIEGTQTIKKANYSLTGTIVVPAGANLTIEAGTNVTVDKSKGEVAIVVMKGGKVNFSGTADMPIVFTAKEKKSGYWGGIIVYGDAPINANGGKPSSQSEDGRAITYGGSNAEDSSGTLKFVRVEYAGSKIGDGNKENNAFTMYSVGSGTIFENCVAYKGADDGVEFFGGTVNCKNFVSYGNTDDAFDWQDGWKGTGENWFGYQTEVGNYGLEVEASGNDNAFSPTVSNITLIRENGCTTENETDVQISALQFKKNGNGSYKNIYVEGYKNLTTVGASGKTYQAFPILIQDQATVSKQVDKDKLRVQNIWAVGGSNDKKHGTGFDAQSLPIPAAQLIFSGLDDWKMFASAPVAKVSLPKGAWATVDGKDLLSAL
jgi:hypothetical protein